MNATPELFPPASDEPGRIKRAGLRMRLMELKDRRGEHHELALELDLLSGQTLLKVYDVDGLTFREATQLLGISKPTGYRLMEEARKAGRA